MDQVRNLGIPIMGLVQVRDLEVPVMDLVQEQVQVQTTGQDLELAAPTLVLGDRTLEDLDRVVLPLNPIRVVAALGPDQLQVLVVQTTALDPVPALDPDLAALVLGRQEVATTRVM